MVKLDPSLNVDPGTMSPFQHGEGFVTEDGAETDLDIGHYERFIDANLSSASSHTAGAIWQPRGKVPRPTSTSVTTSASSPGTCRPPRATPPARSGRPSFGRSARES